MSLGLSYHLVKTYNASNFFNEFAYYIPFWPDPTFGAKPSLVGAPRFRGIHLPYVTSIMSVATKPLPPVSPTLTMRGMSS